MREFDQRTAIFGLLVNRYRGGNDCATTATFSDARKSGKPGRTRKIVTLDIRDPKFPSGIDHFLQTDTRKFVFGYSQVSKMRQIRKNGLEPSVLGEDLTHARIIKFFYIEGEH